MQRIKFNPKVNSKTINLKNEYKPKPGPYLMLLKRAVFDLSLLTLKVLNSGVKVKIAACSSLIQESSELHSLKAMPPQTF